MPGARRWNSWAGCWRGAQKPKAEGRGSLGMALEELEGVFFYVLCFFFFFFPEFQACERCFCCWMVSNECFCGCSWQEIELHPSPPPPPHSPRALGVAWNRTEHPAWALDLPLANALPEFREFFWARPVQRRTKRLDVFGQSIEEVSKPAFFPNDFRGEIEGPCDISNTLKAGLERTIRQHEP